MTNINEVLPEGTHHIVDTTIEMPDGPPDYEIEVNWNCFEACQKAFPDAEVQHIGYPDNYVLVTPVGCIEGLIIDTIMYASDETMVEFTTEINKMTNTEQQMELPLE